MGKKKSNFKCKYCGKPHKAKKGQVSHERACPSRPGPKVKSKKKAPLLQKSSYFVVAYNPKKTARKIEFASCREEADACIVALINTGVRSQDIQVYEASKIYSIETHLLIKLTQK